MQINQSDFNEQEMKEHMQEQAKKPLIIPYKLELFLSTDGKHTVHLEVPPGMDIVDPLDKAKSLYDKIVEKYGSKAKAQEVKQSPTGLKSLCSTCGTEMNYKSGFGQKGKWEALMCPNSVKGQPGHEPVWL